MRRRRLGGGGGFARRTEHAAAYLRLAERDVERAVERVRDNRQRRHGGDQALFDQALPVVHHGWIIQHHHRGGRQSLSHARERLSRVARAAGIPDHDAALIGLPAADQLVDGVDLLQHHVAPQYRAHQGPERIVTGHQHRGEPLSAARRARGGGAGGGLIYCHSHVCRHSPGPRQFHARWISERKIKEWRTGARNSRHISRTFEGRDPLEYRVRSFICDEPLTGIGVIYLFRRARIGGDAGNRASRAPVAQESRPGKELEPGKEWDEKRVEAKANRSMRAWTVPAHACAPLSRGLAPTRTAVGPPQPPLRCASLSLCLA